ncbi:hypothetical protein BDZ97DRAFT_1931423 [Flammula alnicola]|nr:hypothetical protein BDZ97DRAFT_1931423 [Flammula alnicola]
MPRGRRNQRLSLRCPYRGCPRTFRAESGRTNHVHTVHSGTNGHRVAQNPETPQSPNRQHQNHSTAGSPSGPPSDYPDLPEGGPPSPDRPQPGGPGPTKTYHHFLDGRPCDENGHYLPIGSPCPPRPARAMDDWSPFDNDLQFKIADFLYRQEEMSQGKIDHLLELWALSLMKHGSLGPFDSYKHIYDMIDAVEEGDAPWKCFKTTLDETVDEDAPNWKKQEYEVWYRDPETVVRNMLANPDFDKEFDVAPYVDLDAEGGRRRSDFMSANFAWRQCDIIYEENPADNEGSMFVPIILGSDKTTVTVGTGDIEYHPLYLSIGNVHNTVRRAHRNAVIPIGFLAIPKSDRKYDNDVNFRRFKRQLYHSSISAILSTLKPAMSTPAVYRCPDGHFRRAIFGIGPFIADYPEQVMLSGIKQGWCPRCTALPSDIDGAAGARRNALTDALLEEFDSTTLWDEYGVDAEIIPFTRDFPRADIHELISSDLLHQAIKGTFKDHLVEWVGAYLDISYEKAEADRILDEIDRRLAATPAFPELRRFKQGRRFKQWTGDDSKALMKIYLPAIHGLLPPDAVKCIAAFLDFCYLARRSDFDKVTLNSLDEALHRFHTYRKVFRSSGVRESGFSLPRQHSLVHYRINIQDFGAPNGLCSSITESRHITAVKKPWRRSNRYEALGQMLITNQRLDKLAAARADFVAREMLPPDRGPPPGAEDDDDDGGPTDDERIMADVQLARTKERRYPSDIFELANYIHEPALPTLLRTFLDQQLDGSQPAGSVTDSDSTEDVLEMISGISVFHSATSSFYAPSDPSGIRGMRRERIRSTPSWRSTGARRDCVFVVEKEDQPGFRGMSAVRVKMFFSFMYEGEEYPCALVEWFKKVGRSPEEQTGMWVVKPEEDRYGKRLTTIVHLDTIVRGAHLIPVYGSRFIPAHFRYNWSLDAFKSFFVNKFTDHHANEIAF